MPVSVTSPLLRRSMRPLAVCALVGVCASPVQAQAHRTSPGRAKPLAGLSESVHSLRDSLVAVARAQVGTRYIRGGTSPEHGFDCSGLVRYVMAALEVKMPRTARLQATTGVAVVRDASRLRPGDLLTFGNGERGASHVGIYIGGGRYVHASSGAHRVIVSNIGFKESSLVRSWRGVRRIIAGQADSTRKGDDS